MRLSDRRGTLYEIPLLFVFLMVSLAIGFGQRSWWKGPVYAFLGFAAVFAVIFLVELVGEKLETVPALKGITEWRLWDWLGAALVYSIGVVGGGAGAAFASMFLAPLFSQSPEGQLLAMRLLTLAGALGGCVVVWRARRAPARF